MRHLLLTFAIMVLAPMASTAEVLFPPALEDVPTSSMRDIALKHARKSACGMAEVPGPSSDLELVTETPAGVSEMYSKHGEAYGFNMMVGMTQMSNEGYLSTFIREEDGETVWFNNPFSLWATPGWVKGTLADGVVTVEFPQLVKLDDYGMDEYNDYAMLVEYREDEEGGWFYPSETQTYRLNLLDDGTLEVQNPDVMVGLCNWLYNQEAEEYQWTWFMIGDINTSFTPFKKETVEVPEGVKWDATNMISDDLASPCSIAFHGDDVYLKGFVNIEGVEDGVIKGKRSDNKISFPSDQYLGISADLPAAISFYACDVEVMGSSVTALNAKDEVVYDYDSASGRLPSDTDIDIATSTDINAYRRIFLHPSFAPYRPEVKINHLRTPSILGFQEWDPIKGRLGLIFFTIYNTDEALNVLNDSDIFWNLIIDDEPMTFYTDEYPSLEEDTTDIPFAYTSPDGMMMYMEGMQIASFMTLGYTSIGVRQGYRQDGEVVYSPVGWVPGFESSSVNAMTSEETIVSTKWFDLQGRLLSSPQPGVCVRADLMNNGQTIYTKTMIR